MLQLVIKREENEKANRGERRKKEEKKKATIKKVEK
jgi:hypothetical protein